MAVRNLFGLAANLCSGLTFRFANITGRMNAPYLASSTDKGAKFSASPGGKAFYQLFCTNPWAAILGAEHSFHTSAVNLFYHPKKISELAKLYRIHYAKPKIRTKRRHPLEGNPQLKGVVLKTLIKKPKKPNSANRKCVLVRLSTGKEVVAHIPGEGHNLQEHNIVLVRGGRTQDVPGLRLKVVRGKYDCAHVIKKKDV